MITRLLESFNTLDSYSKTVFERHAKKNYQQSMPRHCFAYDKGNIALVLHCNSVILNPRTSIYEPKSNEENVDDKQDHHPERLRISKSLRPITSMKGTSSIRSVEVIGSKIYISPFTRNENPAWTSPTKDKSSGGSVMHRDKEEEGMGFMIMSLKKPQTLRPYRRSPHRIKWSREVKNVPSLYALNKDISKASVGSSLGYTDTSHWRSRSFNNEVAGPLKLPASAGILVNQELHQGNDAKFGTSTPHKSSSGEKSEREFTKKQLPSFEKVETVGEKVPLSFEDELERTNSKVLTPRPTSVYKALPIVSETYPVVYSPPQHQREPFSSPGFHSLDPPESSTQEATVRKSKVHSAIIHITESMQADYMTRSLRERQTSEGLHCSRSYSESGLNVIRKGACHVKLRMLSADGNVVKSPDLRRLPLQNHKDVSLSAPTNKGPRVPLVMPRRMEHSSRCVGPVVNGKNPNQTTEEIPSNYSKLLHGSPRRRFGRSYYMSAPQTKQSIASNPKSKMDFLFISKQVTHRQNGVKSVITKQQTHMDDWSFLSQEDFVSQDSGCETFGARGMSSTPTSQVEHSFQEITTPEKSTGATDHAGTEDTSKLSYFLHIPQPINIPTAESLD